MRFAFKYRIVMFLFLVSSLSFLDWEYSYRITFVKPSVMNIVGRYVVFSIILFLILAPLYQKTVDVRFVIQPNRSHNNIRGISLLLIGRIMVVGAIAFLALLAGKKVLQFKSANYYPPVINEICCKNFSVRYDLSGNYGDFFTIYNPSTLSRDLSGWYLSDKEKNLCKWQFPEGTIIEPNQEILLWAENRDCWTNYESNYTGFSIKAGETVYLSNSEMMIVDSVCIPNDLGEDQVWVRNSEIRDYSRKHVYISAPVSFTVSSGCYNAPFYLSISSTEKRIYYTLDSTTPSSDAICYNGGVFIDNIDNNPNNYSMIDGISVYEDMYYPNYSIDKAVVVRAVAVTEKGEQGEEAVGTFFVNSKVAGNGTIGTISLVTDPLNLFDYEKGIYVSGKVFDDCKENAQIIMPNSITSWPSNYNRSGKKWQKDAYILFFDQYGKLVYQEKCGIGIHGAWSVNRLQKGFNLYNIGENYLFAGILGTDITSLMLRNSGARDCYSTKFRQPLIMDLIRERDVLALKSIPCEVFLDGEYWGLYNLQERVTAETVAAHYDVDIAEVIVLKNDNVVSGEESEYSLWQEVYDFAINNDLSNNENYEEICRMIDIQSYIDYCAIEIYIGNCDCFSNNFARWRTRKQNDTSYTDGKWRWIIYDTDESTGLLEGYTDYSIDHFCEGAFTTSALEDAFFSALFKNISFRDRFVDSFMEIANNNFKAERVSSLIDEYENRFGEAMVRSNRRFYDSSFSIDDFHANVNIVREFFYNRPHYILEYLNKHFCE